VSAVVAFEVYKTWVMAAFENVDDAVPLALSYIHSVAVEKGWSDAWLRHAERLVEVSDVAAGVDGIGRARDFWGKLESNWNATSNKVNGQVPTNWDKLSSLWARMRAGDLDASQAPGGLDYAWEWVAESAQDLRNVGAAAGDVVVNLSEGAASGAKGFENLSQGQGGQALAIVVLLGIIAAALR
jgi:hypothetical protein